MPFWCIFAQSAVIRKNIYNATYDGLLFFRKREVREGKKKDKVTRAVGFVGTKHVPGFCEVFRILGSVFGFWQVFCPYEPRYIHYLASFKSFPF